MSDNFYLSVDRVGNDLLVKEIVDGVRKLSKIENYAPHLFILDNDVTPHHDGYTNIKDQPLGRIEFDNKAEMDTFIKRNKEMSGFAAYGMPDITFQYIQGTTTEDSVPYDPRKVNQGMLDIEVFSGQILPDGTVKRGEFPKPEHAKYPITAICVYSKTHDVFVSLGLEVIQGHRLGTYVHDVNDPHIGGCKVAYKGFDDERTMLAYFVERMWPMLSLDLWGGWFSEGFDLPYMINRIQKVLGKNEHKRLSPWNKVNTRTITNKYGQEQTVYDVLGCEHIDYKDLIEKHGFESLPNTKLNTVARVVCGEGKIDYTDEGDLDTLYVRDYNKYIRYNIHDVNLIRLIDNKKQLFTTVIALAYFYKCNYVDVMGTVRPWSSRAYDVMKRDFNQIAEIKSPFSGEIEFVGGFVKEPVPAKYGWGVSCDATSLYPSMGRQFNMGNNTIVDDDIAHYVRQQLVEEIRQWPDTEYNQRLIHHIGNGVSMHEWYFNTEKLPVFKTLKRFNLCMSPNVQFFRQDRTGMLRHIWEHGMVGRKAEKDKGLEKQREAEAIKVELMRRGVRV